MAVRLVEGVERLLEDATLKIAQKAVIIEKHKAPVSSGQLMASIHYIKTGKCAYIITTQAFGDNGFQYPARVEAGQDVVPTQAKVLRFVVHDTTVYAKRTSVKPTRSHFADKTIKNLHI